MAKYEVRAILNISVPFTIYVDAADEDEARMKGRCALPTAHGLTGDENWEASVNLYPPPGLEVRSRFVRTRNLSRHPVELVIKKIAP